MNLPDSAIEFLDSFRGILSPQTLGSNLSYNYLPMVHCHCFTRFLDESEAEADLVNRCAKPGLNSIRTGRGIQHVV